MKVPDPNSFKGVFHKVDDIKPKTLPKPGQLQLFTYRGQVKTKARGVYLAFRDQGACLAITKVIISFNYCPERHVMLMKFPRTAAPVNNSLSVVGECTDANSVSEMKLSAVCLRSGQWNIPSDMKCVCKAGYELVSGPGSSKKCKLRGVYKIFDTVRALNVIRQLPNHPRLCYSKVQSLVTEHIPRILTKERRYEFCFRVVKSAYLAHCGSV